MNRIELRNLPLYERERLQKEAGIVRTAVNTQKKEEQRMETQTQHQNPQGRASVEEFFRQLADDSRGKTPAQKMVDSGARAVGYAAIWAPVAVGVGYTLMRLGRRVFSPATLA